MVLSDLQRYLDERSCASLSDMSIHFGIQPHAVIGMLDVLIRKGRVRRVPPGDRCGGCDGCMTPNIDIYEVIRVAELPD